MATEIRQPRSAGSGRIYLDYHATTPADPRVADVVLHYLTNAFGNPSSASHTFAEEAEYAVSTARAHVAALVNASPRNVVFTSGATESINLALTGYVRGRASDRKRGPVRIGLSPVEHRAVLDTCHALAYEGAVQLRWLPVDRFARVDLGAIEDACHEGLDLLCLMAANNEVGTLYPVAAAAAIAANYGVPLFSDATQAVGKIPTKVSEWGIAFLAISAHKMYGPKGCGALIVPSDAAIRPIIHGGGHERGLRSGTLNVPGIAGLGEACRLRAAEMEEDEPLIACLRDELERRLLGSAPEAVVNGDLRRRLAGNLHISIPGVPNGAVVSRLSRSVAISTGSACRSGIEEASHVLQAMRIPQPLADGSLRIGIGKFTTSDEIVRAADLIAEAILDVKAALKV